MNRLSIALLVALLIMPGAGATAASPVAGDVYVYRVINGYNQETRGQLTYRVDKVESDRVSVSVVPDPLSLGIPRTEIYTLDGNWLRHPLDNHDHLVDYEFSTAYPAYVLPLDIGKSWSVRVAATNPATGKRVSVRVDAEVVGAERLTTPSGSYDTLKINRRVYAGDWEGFQTETNIEETDWYAPALGRTVRSESKSKFRDQSRMTRMQVWFRGDWNVVELVSLTRK